MGPGTISPVLHVYCSKEALPGTPMVRKILDSFHHRRHQCARQIVFGVSRPKSSVGNGQLLKIGDGCYDAVCTYSGMCNDHVMNLLKRWRPETVQNRTEQHSTAHPR